jgi:hypothetical protein
MKKEEETYIRPPPPVDIAQARYAFILRHAHLEEERLCEKMYVAQQESWRTCGGWSSFVVLGSGFFVSFASSLFIYLFVPFPFPLLPHRQLTSPPQRRNTKHPTEHASNCSTPIQNTRKRAPKLKSTVPESRAQKAEGREGEGVYGYERRWQVWVPTKHASSQHPPIQNTRKRILKLESIPLEGAKSGGRRGRRPLDATR